MDEHVELAADSHDKVAVIVLTLKARLPVGSCSGRVAIKSLESCCVSSLYCDHNSTLVGTPSELAVESTSGNVLATSECSCCTAC